MQWVIDSPGDSYGECQQVDHQVIHVALQCNLIRLVLRPLNYVVHHCIAAPIEEPLATAHGRAMGGSPSNSCGRSMAIDPPFDRLNSPVHLQLAQPFDSLRNPVQRVVQRADQ